MLIGIDASRAFVKDRTGTENYSYEMIRAMLKLPEARKHDWRLYVREFEGSELGQGVRNPETLEVVKINWKRLWTQGGLALELLRRPVDVLWIPAHTLPILRKGKMKTVVTIHGLEYEYLAEYYDWRKKWYLNKSTEYAVRRADRIIAVSNWTKSQLVERLRADNKKIKVVYEGVGERFMREGLKAEGFELGRSSEPVNPYILFVGTVQPRKNLVRLVEAFSVICKGHALKRRDPYRLMIAGKRGWMSEEIYGAPKKYGVEDRVKFLGRVSDEELPSLYKNASLFVYPSLMEGFGLPVLEAMMMGVPVITSDKGALAEVAGGASLQIDPENVRELAESMIRVLKSRKLQQDLIKKGYKQVKKFSWNMATKKTLRILTETKSS